MTRTDAAPPLRKTSPRRSWPVIAAGLVLLPLALYFAYATAWSAVRQAQAARFMPVQATIVEATLVERTSGSGAPRRTYEPRLRYTYTAGGAVREGTRLHFLGPGRTDRAAVQAVLAQYRPGTQVTAYHDPHDPAVAVLDNTARWPPLPMLLLAIALVAGAGLVLRRGWQPRP